MHGLSSLGLILESDKAQCYLHYFSHYMWIANISKHVPGIFVFLYDILILSPTVSKLQELLNVIECELQALDLTINSKKILLFTYRF